MDPHLLLALAEGFDESPVLPLLDPDLEPTAWLREPPGPPVVPPRVAHRLRDPGLAAAAADVLRQASGLGLTVLTPDHRDYPGRLRGIHGRPLVLFARGDATVLNRRPAAGVVGSRSPTAYGRSAAEQIAHTLLEAGVVLWSGLARGIDEIAHRSCLAAAGPTVAVLAGGLDRVYPFEHSALADAIVAGGGCVLSELPPGRRARRGHFVRRNRILAGSTPAVIVVEAGPRSGALHTARFAGELSADVFAVPGPWQSELSQGCHRLIAEGAHLLESPEALLRGLGVSGQGTARQALELVHSADEQAVLAALRHGPRPSDLLQRESGLDRDLFLRALLALETSGLLRRLAGDLWAATKTAPRSR